MKGLRHYVFAMFRLLRDNDAQDSDYWSYASQQANKMRIRGYVSHRFIRCMRKVKLKNCVDSVPITSSIAAH